MTELELLTLWTSARKALITSQLAPTFLLAVSLLLLESGIHQASPATRLAAVGILLASGILGSATQFSALTQAMAVADDLSCLESPSALTRSIVRLEPWLPALRIVTPVIFVLVFVAEVVALFAG